MDLRGRTLAVTGAGGFIGLRLVECARARGHRVRGLELSAAAAERARAAGAEVIVGDVSDPDAVRALCEGAGAVVHTAAVVEEGGDWALFRRVNVEGSRLVARVARDSGARRLVHLSSMMVYGFSYTPWVTEAGPLAGDGNPYNQTKIEAEAAIAPLQDRGRFEVVVLRPGDVYGPGSVPWVIRPLDLWRRHLFALPAGGRGILNHLYVDNLVDAIFLALEQDAAEGPYNVTDGRATTFREFYRRLGPLVGLRGSPPTVPAVALRGLGRALAAAGKLTGHPALFAPDAVSFLMRPHPISSVRIARELGFTPRVGLDTGLGWTAQWYRNLSLARPAV